MLQRIKYAARILLLILYSAYALSPIYAAASSLPADGRYGHRQTSHHIKLGIVWVNVLLSSLVDDEIDGQPERDTSVTSVSEAGDDLILIRKKRMIFRERQSIPSPPHVAYTQPFASTDLPLVVFHDHEILLAPSHQDSDGYRSLHAGLSPPLSFS